jgi:hypothetical protein
MRWDGGGDKPVSARKSRRAVLTPGAADSRHDDRDRGPNPAGTRRVERREGSAVPSARGPRLVTRGCRCHARRVEAALSTLAVLSRSGVLPLAIGLPIAGMILITSPKLQPSQACTRSLRCNCGPPCDERGRQRLLSPSISCRPQSVRRTGSIVRCPLAGHRLRERCRHGHGRPSRVARGVAAQPRSSASPRRDGAAGA